MATKKKLPPWLIKKGEKPVEEVEVVVKAKGKAVPKKGAKKGKV